MSGEQFRIYTYPEQVLRLKAETVDEISDEMREYLDRMVEFMYEADGVGLAAPQIGDSRRIVVIDAGDGPVKIINPEIVKTGNDEEIVEEGCLSLPGFSVRVKRPVQISVTYTNENGKTVQKELDGLGARAFQHEVDHLNGILIIDHASSTQRALLRSKLRKLEKENR